MTWGQARAAAGVGEHRRWARYANYGMIRFANYSFEVIAPMGSVAEIEELGSRQQGAEAGVRTLQNLRKFCLAAAAIAVLVVLPDLRLAAAEPAALSEP